MTTYILQAILFQLLFLLVYEILLKKETFFSYNRWYLLITAVLSLLLPFIQIEALSILVPETTLTQIPTIFLPEVYIGGESAAQSLKQIPANETGSTGSILYWWPGIYLIGVLVALVIVLKKYNNLNQMFRFKKIAAEGKITIIEVPNSAIACTFYRTIFLGDQLTEAEKQHILSHELVHVKQKHSLDLVFFEVLKVIFWFNPLIYIYQNRITTLHEFIADAAVVETSGKRSYYEQLLNSAFSTKNISFINQFFNHSLIKKRILMLQRSRSKTVAKVKYIVLLPLILLMLTYVGYSGNKSQKMDDFRDIQENILSIKPENIENQKSGNEIIPKLNEEEKNNFDSNPIADLGDKKTVIQSNEQESREYISVNEIKNRGIKTEKPFKPGDQKLDIPFAVVEQIPLFPGCEVFESREEQKKCTTDKVQEFVTRNFNTNMAKKLGITGMNRVIVVFKISSEGKITNVRARAPHPALEAEAIRVVESLPQMIPGEHKGKKVAVSYSLPIVFQVSKVNE